MFNSWRLSGGVSRQLLKRLTGSASAFYGRGEFASFKIKDNYVGANAVLAIELTKNVRATLGYTYSETASTIGIRDYRKNVISLGIESEF